MTTKNAIQSNYEENAEAYSQFLTTPLGTLEKQLFDLSIKDLDGLKVLDLGGGTGLRAREALDAGAASVDVVDISEDMMRLGQEHGRRDPSSGAGGRDEGRIRWFQGDAGQDLGHLGLGPYDMVIANGIFDHARGAGELEAMWRNTALYLKPGGRLIANRNNPASGCAAAGGRYGVTFRDFDHFPGGYNFRYCMHTSPPLEFKSTALDVYASGALDVPGKFFEDFRNVPWQDTPVVKADPNFWKEYLADPILYIFTARKKSE